MIEVLLIHQPAASPYLTLDEGFDDFPYYGQYARITARILMAGEGVAYDVNMQVQHFFRGLGRGTKTTFGPSQRSWRLRVHLPPHTTIPQYTTLVISLCARFPYRTNVAQLACRCDTSCRNLEQGQPIFYLSDPERHKR